MADEQETIAAAPELETPAIAAPEAETPETPDVEQPETVGAPEPEADEGDEETVELEYVTVERNGKKYQVPKELEGEFLMQADYTRKRQADVKAAEDRVKALESREAEINQKAEATEAELDARAELRAVSSRLAEYAKLTPQDWAAHRANDPLGTENAWTEFQLLRDRRAELEGSVTKAQSERTAQAQQDLAKRVQETLKHAESNDLGYTPARIPELVQFAQEMGIPEKFMTDNWSPKFADMLHLAALGKQLMSKPTPAPKAPTPAPAKPLATVSGKSTPSANRSLSEVAKSGNMEEYARLRAAGRTR